MRPSATQPMPFADTSRIRDDVQAVATRHLNARDAETALGFYSEDAVVVSDGYVYPSFESFCEHVREFYATLEEVIIAKWDDVRVDVLSVDAAVFTARFVWISTDSLGRRTDLRGVWTAAFSRREAGWTIVHRHESFERRTN